MHIVDSIALTPNPHTWGLFRESGETPGADKVQPHRAPLQKDFAVHLVTKLVAIKGLRIPPRARRELLELAVQLSWTTTKGSGSPQPTSTTGAATQVGWLVGRLVGWWFGFQEV